MKINFKSSALSFASAIVLGSSLALSASAQTIEQDVLGAPTAFDAGVIDVRSGGLNPNLWQGTSAALATDLIKRAPIESADPLIKDMLGAVLLSSGIPPEGDTESLKRYELAKLKAVTSAANADVVETFLRRNSAAARTPIVQVETALRNGDISTACNLSDTITEGRSEVFWSRLRTLCHLERDELAAAELTTDLLRSNDYENDLYFDLVKVLSGASKRMPEATKSADPINKTLYDLAAVKLDAARPGQAFDKEADPELRLAALFKFSGVLSDTQISQVLTDLATQGVEPGVGVSVDFETARADKSAKGIAQLFSLANVSPNPEVSSKAFTAFLERVPDNRARQRFTALMMDKISQWPAAAQAQADLALFSKLAVRRSDVLTLQDLYRSIEDDTVKARIALAADAIGNGFLLGQMGSDIDSRLLSPENERAKRDALLALALGSQLSSAASETLPGTTFGARKISEGDRAVLKANADNQHIAQLILRLSSLIDGQDLDASSLAFAVETLREVGLSQYAGRLAARDFLDPL